MGWGWAAVGGTIGFFMGGPIGAGIGAAIGGIVGDSVSEETAKQPIIDHVAIIAAVLARVAKADGNVDQKELELITSICTEVAAAALAEGNAEISLAELNLAGVIQESLHSEQAYQCAIEFARVNSDFRSAMMSSAWRVAGRDGDITDDEVLMIQQLATSMGASEEEVFVSTIPYYRHPRDGTSRTYAADVLGVSVDSSPDLIRSRYRELSREYHPDRHASLPESVKELCAKKFAEITEARDVLLQDDDHNFFGLALDGSTPVLVTNRETVLCLFCRQKCRLPPAMHHIKARCPKCQSLLLFEDEMFRTLLSHLNEN